MFDGKGMTLKKPGCARVEMRWNQIHDRVRNLVRKDSYLSVEEAEKRRARHSSEEELFDEVPNPSEETQEPNDSEQSLPEATPLVADEIEDSQTPEAPEPEAPMEEESEVTVESAPESSPQLAVLSAAQEAEYRAILEQYDETGERLENQTYLDTEGGPTTCYVRVDYQLRNGTSLRREWSVSIVNGSDIHRLLTQLVNRTDCRESLMGLDVLRKYGGVSNVAGGYVSQYETGAFADLTRQQAQDLVSHALADAANSRAPIDPLRGGMYNSTNLDIEIRMNTNGKTVSLSLSVPDFAVETKAFLDALEFEEPVDGGSDVPKCYDDCDEPATHAVDEIIYD